MMHGGALDQAIAQYGGARIEWTDLSTGINPVPTPHTPPPERGWTRLPELADERALERAARAAYGVPDALDIAAAPGTQAILQWLPRLLPRSDVAIVGPTYGEHARAWSLAGHAVRHVSRPELADVLVVVNPNNPDGVDRPPGDLVDVGKRLTVIDEAFRDTRPELSAVPLAGERTVVLKSLGKFHGLAGARLGHAIGPSALIEPLRDALGPWAVSGPALHVGREVLSRDQALVARDLRDRAARFAGALEATGVQIVGRTDLFVLTRWRDAATVRERLAEDRILTRAFDYRADWLRLGLPQDAIFERIVVALKRVAQFER